MSLDTEAVPKNLDAEAVKLLKEDAKKMYLALKQLLQWRTRTLIAPNQIPSNQAKGYMEGASAGFAHGSDLAQFVMDHLNFDYDKLEELDSKEGF